ncbi:hypothetical protein LWI29_035615 [Acer saccharum]|uniref:Retrovirus-related Pol polyprotein from transposon TNT 1-94-like beta-barrel domain-containing protein n=1 Tax=Acer saccharum TaxID=4024 RepID=A0AA39VS19_ACESA|nr:hypothetical protein LWI29_035615 [Acer saccharum]
MNRNFFALNQQAFSTKHVGRSLSIYYGKLIAIFQELDYRNKIIMKYPDDVITYKQYVERLRVHIFLSGLDAEFEQIRGEILRKDRAMDLEETYAYVHHDAVRRAIVNGEADHSESSAMVARRGKPQQRCYELIGYPYWWDLSKAPHKRNSKGNHASVAIAESSKNTPEEVSSLIATSGNTGKALHTSALNSDNTWIIDSGPTDHMTFDSNHIQSMKPSKQYIVSTTNGTPSPVIGEGSISLLNNLNLDSILAVPSLKHNLLSIAQITHALYRVVIFWPNSCVFKHIRTQKTIGYGTRRGKLYYLDLMPTSSNQLAQVFSVDKSDKTGECPNEENDDCPYESNDDEENEDENSQDNREVVPPISSGPVLQMSQELSQVQVLVSPSS